MTTTLEHQDKNTTDAPDRLLSHLRENGPASSPKMGAALAVSTVTADKHLKRLRDQGLVAKAGALWHLTPAGIARTGALFDPTDLSTVLALLPSEPHRAMVRLCIDAALTRSALAGRGDIGWPSFALYGAPGGLKTGTARLLGRLFGLSDADHVVMATDRGRADLLGGKDHLGKWHPAPTLSHPIITLDELDKAKSEAARETPLRLLQGDSVIRWGADAFRMTATPIATFNAGRDPRDMLPADRLRRLVMICTTDLGTEMECRRAARAIFESGPLPVIDPARITVSPDRVGDDIADYFDELEGYLTADGRKCYPAHGLSLVVPGRAAFHGIDNMAAAIAVGYDYLTTASTWGGTSARNVAAYCRRHGLDGGPPTDDTTARAIATDERAEAVELAEVKARGKAAIGAEVKALGRPSDDEGIRLVAALREVARQLAGAKGRDDLLQIDALFDRLSDRIDARASAIAGRQVAATGRTTVSTRRGRVAPDRLAILTELQRGGSRERVAATLLRLGLIAEYPMPVGRSERGRRYQGATPATVGAVVWEWDGWSEGSVRAILADAIATEMANAPDLPNEGPPALLAWSGSPHRVPLEAS
jgi:hypothetical protein